MFYHRLLLLKLDKQIGGTIYQHTADSSSKRGMSTQKYISKIEQA